MFNCNIYVFVVWSFLMLMGCSSMPSKPTSDKGQIIHKGITEVHAAALDALTVNGFDVSQDAEDYIQGKRPNKIGLFVGSGGEIIGVWFEKISDTETKVFVRNQKTMVGYVGQKNWESEILAEILRLNESK